MIEAPQETAHTHDEASEIAADTSAFADLFSSTQDTVQKCLDRLDDYALNKVDGDTMSGDLAFSGAGILSADYLGLGSAAIPHGAVGIAKLALEGTDASTAGPHAQFTTASDDYPLLSIVPWQHDLVYLAFDAYYTGTVWQSSDLGSNFLIAKVGNALSFQAETNITPGSNITWVQAFYVTAGGDTRVSGSQQLQFRDSAIYINSNDDGHLDLTADTSIDLNAATVAISGDFTVTGGDLYVGAEDTTRGVIYLYGPSAGTGGGSALFYLSDAYDGTIDYFLIRAESDDWEFRTPSAAKLTYKGGEDEWLFGAPVGIGASAVPKGGFGGAKLAIEGTNASTAGPHIQLTTASDSYPLMQILGWQHNSIGIFFDAYRDDVGYKSGSATSNFGIEKFTSLTFRYASAVAQGGAVTWATSFEIEADGEVLFSPSAARKLYFRDAAISISSQNDGYMDYEADTGHRFNTGSIAVDGGLIYAGLNNSVPGSLYLYGDTTSSTQGGRIYLYAAATHDGSIDAYQIRTYEDDFEFCALNTPKLTYKGAEDEWLFGAPVGIGVSAVPEGGVGEALLALEGAPTTVQFTTSTDNYPLITIRASAHDNMQLAFDAYLQSGAWLSSDAGSNFLIQKGVDVLSFRAEASIAQGGAITWVEAFKIEADAEVMFSPSAARKLYFRDAAIYIASLEDGRLDIEADVAIRANANFQVNNTAATIVTITGTTYSRLTLHDGTASTVEWGAQHGYDAGNMLVGAGAGRQWIIGDAAWWDKDFDHAVQTHPTLYGQDARDPNVSNNAYWQIQHDGTGMLIATGPNTGAGSAPATIDNYIRFSPRAAEQMRLTGDGKLGLGTTTAPHGGVGAAKLAIDGADSSTEGPHVQFTTASDDYPVMTLLNWRHDLVAIHFDAYYDGAHRSSDAGSNFSIFKNGDRLYFYADESVAAGDAVGFVHAFWIESDAEVMFSSGAARKLYFRDAAISINSATDGHLDLDADVSIDLNQNTTVANAATHSYLTILAPNAATQAALKFDDGTTSWLLYKEASETNLYFYNGSKLITITPTGGLGIGTGTSVPHGGVGIAKLAIDGTAASTAGPHQQFTVSTDDYPTLQILNWSHDSVQITFDGYFDGVGNWYSSDAGSNFRIAKYSDALHFEAEQGIAQGAAVTFVDAFYIVPGAEMLYSPAAARKMYFRDTAIYLQSVADSYLDIVADGAVRIAADTLINGAAETPVSVLDIRTGAVLTAFNPLDPLPSTGLTFSATDPGVVAAGYGLVNIIRPIKGRGAMVGWGGIYEGTNKDTTCSMTFYTNAAASQLEEVMRITSNSKIGINTSSIPRGGVGAAMLALDGANGSDQGPHIQFTTISDNYPLLQIRPYAHDGIALGFDAYYVGGAWYSGDAGSNFMFQKSGDAFRFYADASIAQGGAVTFVEAFNIQSDAEVMFSPSAARKLYFRDSGIWISSTSDGWMTLTADAGINLGSSLVYCNWAFGIGTATVPHGGVGNCRLAIDGTDSSAANGPHIQVTTASDNYPLFQQLNWAHDDISLVFDAYYDGAWKSSDAGSNFRIAKVSDALHFYAEASIAQGNAVTWVDAFNVQAGGGIIVSPNADRTLSFRDFAVHIASLDDGHLDLTADVMIDLNCVVTALPGTNQLRFRDAAIYINSADDGHLDLTADTAIDLNGNVFIPSIKSGATQVAAGAAAGELWKTASHATLPDNVVMIGV